MSANILINNLVSFYSQWTKLFPMLLSASFKIFKDIQILERDTFGILFSILRCSRVKET